YTSKLTVDNSVPTDYLSGSLRSLSQIGADYDLSTYNNAIANLYFAREDYQAKLNRIRQIINQADDYNLNDAKIAEYGKHYDG
ncbi:hypothetical protein, partial [Serratia marcescens]|uniref:hypothetical protein n=1 Tax=Serratia marcescens TaxID=615 RepID=UPI0019534210